MIIEQPSEATILVNNSKYTKVTQIQEFQLHVYASQQII